MFEAFFIKEFLIGSGVRKSSKLVYFRCLGYFLEWIGSTGRNEKVITSKDLSDYADHLQQGNLSRHTQSLYLSVLRKYFKWLNKKGVCSQSLANVISLPKRSNKTKRHPITIGQLKKLIKSIDQGTTEGRRDVAMILMSFSLGLRPQDLSRLDIGSIINADNDEGPDVMVRVRMLNSPPVNVILDGFVWLKLREYFQKDRIPEAAMPYIIGSISYSFMKKLPLFIALGKRHQSGQNRLTPGAIGTIITRRMKEAGLGENYTSGSLRSGTAHFLFQSGMKPQEVKATMRLQNMGSLRTYLSLST